MRQCENIYHLYMDDILLDCRRRSVMCLAVMYIQHTSMYVCMYVGIYMCVCIFIITILNINYWTNFDQIKLKLIFKLLKCYFCMFHAHIFIFIFVTCKNLKTICSGYFYVNSINIDISRTYLRILSYHL